MCSCNQAGRHLIAHTQDGKYGGEMKDVWTVLLVRLITKTSRFLILPKVETKVSGPGRSIINAADAWRPPSPAMHTSPPLPASPALLHQPLLSPHIVCSVQFKETERQHYFTKSAVSGWAGLSCWCFCVSYSIWTRLFTWFAFWSFVFT